MLWKDWRAEVDVDVADNEIDVKDFWISYDRLGFIGSGLIKVGNFKEPFGLEMLVTSKYMTFLERGLLTVFAPSRHIGIAYIMWGNNWSFSTGVFGEELEDTDKGEDEGYGITGRLTFAPLHQEAKTVHLGLAASYRTPDANVDKPDQVRFRSRPETHVARTRFLNTGRIKDVNNFTLFGLEAATVFGPFSVQGEYIRSHVSRKNGEPDVSFDGAYVFGSWLVSGESRPYINQKRGVEGAFGEFGRIVPKNEYGAWELVLRYSTLDLNDVDGGITGGRARNITIGLNWYANANMRIMANYVIVDTDENADADGDFLGDDDFKIFQMRFQVIF